MAKRGQRRLSKKGLVGLHKVREVIYDENKKPIKSKLARDENNNIIWQYKDKKFSTLREVIVQNWSDLLHIENPLASSDG
jgi:hypothetical protein